MCMGIPTLLTPHRPQEEEASLADPQYSPASEGIKHLLFGTESDPHLHYSESEEVDNTSGSGSQNGAAAEEE